jgi:aryl-alcohol dehydrogenase-like predicted oxidoreductase
MHSKQVITSSLVGAAKLHHLDDAIAAVAVKLTSEEIRHIVETYQPHPRIG